MLNSKYLESMQLIFEDKSKYRRMRYDPTEEYKKEYHKFLDTLVKRKFITKTKKTALTSHAACPPKTYGLVKLHKENLPLRNIVSNNGSITEKMNKIFNTSLNKLARNNTFDVRNSFEAIHKLNATQLGEDHIIVSFDVISMFPNIPLNETYDIIKQRWDEVAPHTDIKDKLLFIEGLRLCNRQYLRFNSQTYRQLDGISMGSSLSVNLSTIYMNNLINNVLTSTGIVPIVFMKYVDDCLCILKKKDVTPLHNALNSYHPNIKFTLEVEEKSTINFLDMTIKRVDGGKLEYEWFSKPMASGRLLNFYSNHPYKQKINVISNFISRVLKLTNIKYWSYQKTKIYKILIKNGYPKKLINKQWHLQEHLIRNSTKYKCLHNLTISSNDTQNPSQHTKIKNKKEESPTNKYTSMTYIKGLSENITKRFRENGIKNIIFGHKGKNKMSNRYPPLKDKLEIGYTQNAIYRLDCQDCDQVYVGQTKSLGNRIKQHQEDIKHKSQKTALCSHAVSLKHNINFQQPKILDKEVNVRKREHLESLHIIMNNKRAMNFKTDIGTKGLLYANLLR